MKKKQPALEIKYSKLQSEFVQFRNHVYNVFSQDEMFANLIVALKSDLQDLDLEIEDELTFIEYNSCADKARLKLLKTNQKKLATMVQKLETVYTEYKSVKNWFEE